MELNVIILRRHASDAMLSRYVRDSELFVGNAAGLLL
jgi:hypothetical protein